MNGVIFPAYGHEATYFGGGWSVGFPLQNLADLVRPSKVARAVDIGTASIALNFPSSRTIQAVAVIGHNLPAGGTFSVSVYSGADFTGGYVAGTGMMPVSGGAFPSGYRRIALYRFPTPVVGRSVYFTFGGLDATLQIEAVEVGGFWEWPMGFGREIGVATADREIELAGGSSYQLGSNRRARTVSGQVDLMKMEETASKGLDFQKGLDIQRPFVWAEDWTDPASWARKCLLVRNLELSPMVGALYRRDRFPIKLIEHMR